MQQSFLLFHFAAGLSKIDKTTQHRQLTSQFKDPRPMKS